MNKSQLSHSMYSSSDLIEYEIDHDCQQEQCLAMYKKTWNRIVTGSSNFAIDSLEELLG
jgi:hypothetical protein